LNAPNTFTEPNDFTGLVTIQGSSNQYGQLRVGFSEIERVELGSFQSGSDISGLISGSTAGHLIRVGAAGHTVLATYDNDVNDSVYIVSGGGNCASDTTYDKLVARFHSNGNVYLGGPLEVNGTITGSGKLSLSSSAADTI